MAKYNCTFFDIDGGGIAALIGIESGFDSNIAVEIDFFAGDID